ncbi:hypothetical protein L6164_003317 [Bauhinia variegata]|uniref:Uncharacterized protein n=1 Tax=Bauhinia variegata TaxID=167791 RepID=A0ACB9Q110_BAUVA|nr:hypothetical protein L6164_003317 [Bauhinia variegata]
MSGPSVKAAELGKTQSQIIGDIHAELLLVLNQKNIEVRKMEKAFLARKEEDNSTAEMIIPPEFVEKAVRSILHSNSMY